MQNPNIEIDISTDLDSDCSCSNGYIIVDGEVEDCDLCDGEGLESTDSGSWADDEYNS